VSTAKTYQQQINSNIKTSATFISLSFNLTSNLYRL